MDITEASIVHHIALVLLLLWVVVRLGWSHPVLFFLALLYLYKVNAYYTLRLRKRLQFEEKKYANQRRLLSDTESVRWLNHAIEKIWPICMEHIASQQFLLPIIPWFLDKFKPWTARKAVLHHLYLGRNPPMFTDLRVLHQSGDDDHLVLELGMSFLSADDMSAKLAVRLRKRLGFGIKTNMHITSMHVEGKVLVGVKFLRHWPFLGRVRVCFVEPPYFQMTVKPIFGHGLDVTELPGISGWLDKLLDDAFEQTLVEPNMLVIDVEKFVSTPEECWFTVKERSLVAHVKLEMLEGADMKPSDLNGLADPYVRGQLGTSRFQTKIQRKTLSPKWLEEFKIPINSWEAPNVLVLQVRDKDTIFDDMLGDCSVNINDLRGGQRHDMWLSLQNIKMGRIHLAITVLEEELQKEPKDLSNDRTSKTMEPMPGTFNEKAEDLNTEEYSRMTDEFEPINIKGQEKTRVWIHRPGADVSQIWESRKGHARHSEELHQEDNVYAKSPSPSSSGSHQSDTSSNEEIVGGKKVRLKTIRRGLHKLSSVFHRTRKHGSPKESQEVTPTPRPHLPPLGKKQALRKITVPDSFDKDNEEPEPGEERCSSDMDKGESPGNGETPQTPKNFISKSSKSLKITLSRETSNKLKEVQSSGAEDKDDSQGTDLSNDASVNDPLVSAGCPTSISTSTDNDKVNTSGPVQTSQDDR
ncbi:C2 domain [Musa troglodytarum]|uniref:C2 domain n=1 Tax=Musa troglodytarum TaxID=320322 RepID=A0A9E7L488_9LILI|nr:C2 domain [Musa troglodytarum]